LLDCLELPGPMVIREVDNNLEKCDVEVCS